MPRRQFPDPDPAPDRSAQFDDELVGLDPADPEAQAFAEHLDRMQRDRPRFTVEGSLAAAGDFADYANRARGARRWAAVALAVLLLAVLAILVWQSVVPAVTM